MKIAYLVSQYPAINHTFILREIRRLREKGFDVAVISIRPADRPRDKLSPIEQQEQAVTSYIKTTALWRVALDHFATALGRPAGYLRGLIEALKLSGGSPKRLFACLYYFVEAVVAGRRIRAGGDSHFHTHFSSGVGLIITRIFPLTMSATFHGPDEFNDPAGFHLARKVAASSFICTISRYGASRVMKSCDSALWDKVEVARLGVNPADFAPRPQRGTRGPVQIICVARLAPIKAQRILIDAVARLGESGREVRLHLVGDGADRPMLEARRRAAGLEERVVFHGWLNQDKVAALYRESDIAALSSFDEGIPVALMEPMAMEIPCVATYVAGVPELIQDGVNGLLVPASDVAALEKALARLVDDAALRGRLGKAGREKILQDFDLLKNVDLLAEIFTRRLAPGGRRVCEIPAPGN